MARRSDETAPETVPEDRTRSRRARGHLIRPADTAVCTDCHTPFVRRLVWMVRCAECGLRRAERKSGQLPAARWWLSKSRQANATGHFGRKVEAA